MYCTVQYGNTADADGGWDAGANARLPCRAGLREEGQDKHGPRGVDDGADSI